MPLRLVTTLFLCYLVAFIDRGLVSVAAAPIRHDLALSDTQLGVLMGPAFVAIYCLCSLPAGWLVDRVSRRALIAGVCCSGLP
jgi:MFS family permease